MADELKQSQLARIVVPAITDVRYAEGMADAFDKINDNFKKIASLPFLQGVQGDSYQLEEYLIWEEEDTGNWILTEDGKVLLNSIFGKDVTEEGNSFTNIRTYIKEELDGVSPLDFFKDGNDIVNNTLYFYVIKDDTGNVIEKQLGQYYYFIDGRIKNIGTVYGRENSSEILSTFNDYTGFYQYRYNPKSYLQKYLRVEILPSIYYDQDKNDICWKFNGNETGISAIGIEGKSGKDATLSIVLVEASINDYSSEVIAEFNYLKDNISDDDIYWDYDVSKIKDGKAIICCKTKEENGEENNESFNFAYGELIRSEDDVLNAYWNPGTMFSHVINDMKITSYFYDMGNNAVASAPHYLAIPSDSDRITGENLNAAHVIRNSSGDLEFFNSSDAFISPEEQNQSPTGTTGTPKTVKLTNYNFKVGKEDDINVHISNDKVRVGSTSYIGSTSAVIDGGLNVKNLTVGSTGNPGKTNLYGETNIYNGNLYIGATGNTGTNGIIIEKGNIQLRNGDIGVTGAINASGDLTVGGNGHIKGTELTLGVQGGTESGKSTTIISNYGSYDSNTGRLSSNFSLNANESRTDHKRYFTINSFSQYYPYGEESYNMARICVGCVGSTASNYNKENYMQICAGEDSIYSNPGARAGIQIHSNADGKNGDVKIKPNLTVEGPGTFKGDVVITNTTSSSSTDTGTLRVTGGISTKENLHVAKELTAHQYINIANSSDATIEQGGSGISSLTDSNRNGHIYIGAPPSNKTSAMDRMLINRHTIQAYTTWDTDGIYKSPTGSNLYLNPCGGNVNISKSGSTTTIKGSAVINDKTTIEGGVDIKNGAKIEGNTEISSGGLSVPINNGIKLTGLGSWGAIEGYYKDISQESHPELRFSDLMSTSYKDINNNTNDDPTKRVYGMGLVNLQATTAKDSKEEYSITITECPQNTLFYFGVRVWNEDNDYKLDNVYVKLKGIGSEDAKIIYTFNGITENSGLAVEFLVFTNSAGYPMFWSTQ